MAKVLVVVSTSEVEKASLGIRWAAAAVRNKWVDDVEVVFFGPVEEKIAEGDERLLGPLKELIELGKMPAACRRVAEMGGYVNKLAERQVKVEYVGELIAKYVKEGYVPLVF
ncbi:MAG: hypothetical protein ABWW70_06195 [Thermoproteota archaeon]